MSDCSDMGLRGVQTTSHASEGGGVAEGQAAAQVWDCVCEGEPACSASF